MMILTGFRLALLALGLGYVTFVLVYSKVTSTLRERWLPNWLRRCVLGESFPGCRSLGWLLEYTLEMLLCSFCTGFWVAVVTQCIFQFSGFGPTWLGVLLTTPTLAMAAALVAYGGGVLIAETGIVEKQKAQHASYEGAREVVKHDNRKVSRGVRAVQG